MQQTNAQCYCGSLKNYNDCCAPYHQSLKTAETAQQLMRSRYSAFVFSNEKYLKKTWLKETCPEILGFDNKTKWIRLDVISTVKGLATDDIGKVEFKAWFIESDKLYCLHEISEFKKENAQWLYSGGEIIDEPVEVLVRNQSCPCNSGKKYKRCCL